MLQETSVSLERKTSVASDLTHAVIHGRHPHRHGSGNGKSSFQHKLCLFGVLRCFNGILVIQRQQFTNICFLYYF